jgi:hypothetical protein
MSALLNGYPSSVAPNACGSMMHSFLGIDSIFICYSSFLKEIVTRSSVLVLDSTFCILLVTGTNSFLGTRSHNCEKRLLTRHARLCVCLSSCSCATPIERISVNFSIEDFYANPSRSSKFAWNRTKTLGSLHKDVNTFYCWQWQVPQQDIKNTLFRFHCSNGYSNAPECCVIRTLPILLNK